MHSQRLPLIALLVLSSLIFGCSREDTAAETSGAHSVATLRVADQFDRLRTVLVSAGEDQPEHYRIEWSNFVGGPTIIAAATGGSIDIGWMAETPLVFAQAAGSPIKIVAAARPADTDTGPYALLVSATSNIHTISDLRGKRVSYMPGTITQYFLVTLLESAGLTLDDVQLVNVAGASGSAQGLLESGQVDALILTDPLLVQAEASGHVRVLATSARPVALGTIYLVVPDDVLKNPSLTPILEDFLSRVVRAHAWQIEHPIDALPTVETLYRLPPDQAASALKRLQLRYQPLDESLIQAQQAQIDTFFRLGLIRAALDAGALFDTRFNATLFPAPAHGATQP